MSRIVGLFNSSCFLRVSLALIIVHGQSQRSIIIVQRCHYYLAVDKLDCSPRIVSGAETGLDDALPMAEHVKLRQ